MPWVYTLTLSEVIDAATIQADWEENIPGNANVQNDLGGVTMRGRRTLIVSQRNNPEFEEMANLSYVDNITEQKEIPKRSDSDFDPPIELGHGIQLVE